MKKLHRLLLTSTAYRQSSWLEEAKQKDDPDNRLVGRMALRRLEAEVVRDALLAVSGQLNRKVGGKPVPVMPDEVGQVVLGVDIRDGAGYPRGKPIPLGDEEFRRSVYVQVRRSLPLAVLETFDAAVAAPVCESRTHSTSAPQSLFLMNSAFSAQRSAALAARVRAEAPGELGAQVRRAWRLAFGRAPAERDVVEGVAFIREQTALYQEQKKPAAQELALAVFCQALLGSNGFLYVD